MQSYVENLGSITIKTNGFESLFNYAFDIKKRLTCTSHVACISDTPDETVFDYVMTRKSRFHLGTSDYHVFRFVI